MTAIKRGQLPPADLVVANAIINSSIRIVTATSNNAVTTVDVTENGIPGMNRVSFPVTVFDAEYQPIIRVGDALRIDEDGGIYKYDFTGFRPYLMNKYLCFDLEGFRAAMVDWGGEEVAFPIMPRSFPCLVYFDINARHQFSYSAEHIENIRPLLVRE